MTPAQTPEDENARQVRDSDTGMQSFQPTHPDQVDEPEGKRVEETGSRVASIVVVAVVALIILLLLVGVGLALLGELAS